MITLRSFLPAALIVPESAGWLAWALGLLLRTTIPHSPLPRMTVPVPPLPACLERQRSLFLS